jgi:glycosyltransferase involved in cell wall biosynthesis
MGLRFLAIGDGVAPTELARIVHSVLRRLPRDEYEIHHLAHNYFGDPHGEDWKIYPASLSGSHYGFHRVRELIERLDPEVVWLVNDLWVQDRYLEILKDIGARARLITYSPVEGPPVDREWLRHASNVETFVVFSEFAREEVLKAGGVEAQRIHVVPLGVDTETFFPIPDRIDAAGRVVQTGAERAKEKLGIAGDGNAADAFVVLNANRNQTRKRIDVTLRAFAAFARGKPAAVKLYLHMGTEDAGWNILKLAERLGIDKRLIISENPNTIPGMPDAFLNWLYNACDVGINTAAAEGWGLVSFEHAACRRAQIVPRLASLEPIWEGACEFLDIAEEFVFEKTLIEGRLVDVRSAANALERLYASRDRRQQIADAGWRLATREELNWGVVARSWDQLFRTQAG